MHVEQNLARKTFLLWNKETPLRTSSTITVKCSVITFCLWPFLILLNHRLPKHRRINFYIIFISSIKNEPTNSKLNLNFFFGTRKCRWNSKRFRCRFRHKNIREIVNMMILQVFVKTMDWSKRFDLMFQVRTIFLSRIGHGCKVSSAFLQDNCFSFASEKLKRSWQRLNHENFRIINETRAKKVCDFREIVETTNCRNDWKSFWSILRIPGNLNVSCLVFCLWRMGSSSENVVPRIREILGEPYDDYNVKNV